MIGVALIGRQIWLWYTWFNNDLILFFCNETPLEWLEQSFLLYTLQQFYIYTIANNQSTFSLTSLSVIHKTIFLLFSVESDRCCFTLNITVMLLLYINSSTQALLTSEIRLYCYVYYLLLKILGTEDYRHGHFLTFGRPSGTSVRMNERRAIALYFYILQNST